MGTPTGKNEKGASEIGWLDWCFLGKGANDFVGCMARRRKDPGFVFYCKLVVIEKRSEWRIPATTLEALSMVTPLCLMVDRNI